MRRSTPPSMSIHLDYISLPPQLVAWKAFKSHHFLLAAVSTITILANVLAVALGSLFQLKPTVLSSPTHSQTLFAPHLLDDSSKIDRTLDPWYMLRANITKNAPLPAWTSEEFYFLPVKLPAATSASLFEVVTPGFGITSECQFLFDPGSGTALSFSYPVPSLNCTDILMDDEAANITCALSPDRRESQSEWITCFSEPLRFSGRQALAFDTVLNSPYYDWDDSCREHGLLSYTWVHAAPTEDYHNMQGLNAQKISEMLIVGCQPHPQTANFLVRTTQDGRVLNYTRESDLIYDMNEESVSYLEVFLSMTSSGSLSWRNDTTAPNWSNYILKYIIGSDALLNPNEPLANASRNVIPALQNMHRRLFSIILSRSPGLFNASEPGATTQGTIFTTESRIFMNNTSFIISVVILTLNLIVAILYYLNRPLGFLPRMPTSIASVFAYVAASHAAQNLQQGIRSDAYRFGRYIGIDGKMHIGIEEASRVFPLPASHRENRIMGWFGLKKRPPPVPPKD